MWAELFYYLTKTKGLTSIRSGHRSEMASYMARYRREKKNWDLHFKECHFWIKQFIAENPKRRERLLIFGAGEMFDIPSEILPQFKEVVAFDIVETARVREIKKIYPHVRFQEADLSSYLKKWEFHFSTETDLVLSMNVLSQLPLIPLNLLHKKKYSDSKLEVMGQKIISEHLNLLNKHNGLLIADVVWNIEGEVYDPYFKVSLGPSLSEWSWQLDSKRSNIVGVWKTKNFFPPEK